MAAFECRHCGRPIAVPASRCPWCNETIMVICANCKTYTDDQKPHCEQCGVPLQPDRMERIALQAHQPELARLVEDRERARLVASSLVVNNAGDFFYAGQSYRTVLAELFDSVQDSRTVAAGAIFAAYAYLCQTEYIELRLSDAQDQEEIALSQLRPWDGQNCIESALARQAGRALTTAEATEKMARELMGFRLMQADGSTLRAPKTREAPERPAPAAVDYLARVTVLPEHDRREACRDTYHLLSAFVEADRRRARLLSIEIRRVLDALGNRA
jgi:hypothetical protein